MTINGAITQLVMMVENSMMPNIFRPALDKVIETISELEPEPHWIPCSEMLPEKKGIYPVWTAVGFGNHLSSSYWDGEEWTLRVDAWALLPPYREEADE